MGVTSSCDEKIFTSLDIEEPDYDRPVSNEELIAALERRTRPFKRGERVEVDLVGDDEFGV